MVRYKSKFIFLFIVVIFVFTFSCNKQKSSACEGKTISFAITIDSTSNDTTTDGKITVVASGSNGFTYKLNYEGTFIETNVFPNLKYGNYDIYAKDEEGCVKIKHVTVVARDSCTVLPGVTFTQVRYLMDAKCISCHNNTSAAVVDYTINCNVLLHRDSIYYRTFTIGDMPPDDTLSPSEKLIITDWINAGGKISD